MSENTCRICRCEATSDNPLYYPCKCRGSIKYIHQDCLIEWLNHSQREPKCDICDIPYKFTTVYEENTPDRVPASFILRKTFQIIISFLTSALMIFNCLVFVVLQIPIFFKMMSRICTWIIDNRLPYPESILKSLIFGDYFLFQQSQQPHLPDFSHVFNYTNAFLIFKLTFVDGFIYLLSIVLIHLVLFLVHKLVTSDEGFTKLVKKKFGSIDKDLLQLLIQRNRIRNLVREVEENDRNNLQDPNNNMNHHMDHFRNFNGPIPMPPPLVHLPPEVLARQAERPMPEMNEGTLRFLQNAAAGDHPNRRENVDFDDINDNEHHNPHPLFGNINRNIHNDDPFARDIAQPNPDEVEHAIFDIMQDRMRENQIALNFHRNMENNIENGNDSDNDHDSDFGHETDNDDEDVGFGNDFGNGFGNLDHHINDNDINEDEELDNEDIDQNNEADGNNANLNERRNRIRFERDNFQINIDIGLSPLSPIKTACTVNPILAIWLAIFYSFPSVCGGLFITGVAKSTEFLFNNIIVLLWNETADRLSSVSLVQSYASLFSEWWSYDSNLLTKYLLNTVNFFYQLVLKPVLQIISNIANSNYPLTSYERMVTIAVSYLLSGFIWYRVMKYFERQKSPLKPLIGWKRKVALIIFEVFATLKVYFIFLLELVIFPIYCGFLVDFVIAPLILTKFDVQLVNPFDSNNTISENVLRVFASNELYYVKDYFSFSLSFQIVYYWLIGTTYMCFLSLFVSMSRSHILRPGVLYFIRSPDDQNARLLHDALVKPLKLQLSRIALSGLIYTIFIIVCIGAVTYSLRFFSPLLLTDSSNNPIELLPIRMTYKISSFLLLNPVIWKLSKDSQLITKYVRAYWKRAFRVACHNLRLSSFILDIEDPQERGHFIYRTIFHQLFSKEVPDYSNPQAESMVSKYFQENPQVNVAFIPDGNYVRAPDHEAVSRKALKKLFVPVTRDDVLLAPVEEEKDETTRKELEKKEQEERERAKADYESESEDEEVVSDGYTVVYRPPQFKYRVLGLLLYMWGFSVFLIASVALSALIIGRPITLLMCKYGDYVVLNTITFGNTGEYCVRNLEIDLPSIVFGVFAMSFGLAHVDEYLEKRASAVRNQQEEQALFEENEADTHNEEDGAAAVHYEDYEHRDRHHIDESDGELEHVGVVAGLDDQQANDNLDIENENDGDDDDDDDDAEILNVNELEIRDDTTRSLKHHLKEIVQLFKRSAIFCWSIFLAMLTQFAAIGSNLSWLGVIHIGCIDDPYSYLTGAKKNVHVADYSLSFNKTTISLHLFVGLFTLVPLFYRMFIFSRDISKVGVAESFSSSRVYSRLLKPLKKDFYLYYGITIVTSTVLVLMQYQFGNCQVNLATYVWKEISGEQCVFQIGDTIISEPLVQRVFMAVNVTGFIIVKIALFLNRYFELMNEVVKNEIYGKSQRLENMELKC